MSVCLIAAGVIGSPVGGQEASEHRPVLSPDGQRVVFMRQSVDTDGDWELYITDRSSGEAQRLTRSPGWDGYAVFSPDGKTLVFDRSTDGTNESKQPHLLVLASGETEPLSAYEGWLSVTDWSEEHGLLAFWEREGQRDLYLLSADGSVVQRLTYTEELSEHDAHFSPDGDRIAFASGPSTGNGPTALEVMGVRRRDRQVVVQSRGRIYGPAWAPDGRRIAFTDAPDGDNGDIFLVELTSGQVDRLTTEDAWDHMPVWMPEGDRLLFTSYRTGSERMYWLDMSSGAIEQWVVR